MMRQLMMAALAATSTALMGPAASPAQIPGLNVARPAAQPDVEVSLLANRSALVPGAAVDLAIRFKIERDWHIYWRNSGDSGLPPTFKWKLPEGFVVGPMRFPPPVRHVDAADLHTFILEGEPTILTELRVPPSATPGQDVTIAVDVVWLVCKMMCVRGSRSLTLTLPVVTEPAAAAPANEALFDQARRQLPAPPGKAPHLTSLSAQASVDRIVPGAKFKVAVVLDVPPGHHINSHEPTNKDYIATDAFADVTDGLLFEHAQFPKGRVEPIPGTDEKASVYRGRTVIVLPAEAEAELDAKDLRLAGVVTYQVCNDADKTCLPPSAAEWELRVPVARKGEAATNADPAMFVASTEGGEPGTVGAATGQSPPSADAALPKGGPGGSTTGGTWLARVQDWLAARGMIGYLTMALLGGFILNLMPCVLPVISIKILSFVQQAKESRLRVFTLGLTFAVGIEVSFLILGGLVVGLGQHWGGLFQLPQFSIGMAAVVLAFSLSLFGVFSLFPPRLVNELGGKVQQEGHLSAFGMGLLATMLGTACTAPFFSAAIAIAVKQTAATGMLIFATAGVGMAFPYVLLAAKPAWVRLIPRPGPWMKTFEHVVGFLLLATAVWLINPLAVQIGGEGVVWTLLFLLLVAVAVWLYGKVEYGAPPGRKAAYYGAAAALVAGGWLICFRAATTIPDLVSAQRELRLGAMVRLPGDTDWQNGRIPWVPYTRERALTAVDSGRIVFVDYTASWCASCKTNEKIAINTPGVRDAMRRLRVVPFKADYTSFDPEIREDFEKYGRASVPMYLVIPARRPERAEVLPELLTPSVVVDALERAAAQQPDAAVSLSS